MSPNARRTCIQSLPRPPTRFKGRKPLSRRATPAMAAGIADHVWSLEEIVGLL